MRFRTIPAFSAHSHPSLEVEAVEHVREAFPGAVRLGGDPAEAARRLGEFGSGPRGANPSDRPIADPVVELLCLGPPRTSAKRSWSSSRTEEWARAVTRWLGDRLRDTVVVSDVVLHVDHLAPHVHIVLLPFMSSTRSGLRLSWPAVRPSLALPQADRKLRQKSAFEQDIAPYVGYCLHVLDVWDLYPWVRVDLQGCARSVRETIKRLAEQESPDESRFEELLVDAREWRFRSRWRPVPGPPPSARRASRRSSDASGQSDPESGAVRPGAAPLSAAADRPGAWFLRRERVTLDELRGEVVEVAAVDQVDQDRAAWNSMSVVDNLLRDGARRAVKTSLSTGGLLRSSPLDSEPHMRSQPAVSCGARIHRPREKVTLEELQREQREEEARAAACSESSGVEAGAGWGSPPSDAVLDPDPDESGRSAALQDDVVGLLDEPVNADPPAAAPKPDFSRPGPAFLDRSSGSEFSGDESVQDTSLESDPDPDVLDLLPCGQLDRSRSPDLLPPLANSASTVVDPALAEPDPAPAAIPAVPRIARSLVVCDFLFAAVAVQEAVCPACSSGLAADDAVIVFCVVAPTPPVRLLPVAVHSGCEDSFTSRPGAVPGGDSGADGSSAAERVESALRAAVLHWSQVLEYPAPEVDGVDGPA